MEGAKDSRCGNARLADSSASTLVDAVNLFPYGNTNGGFEVETCTTNPTSNGWQSLGTSDGGCVSQWNLDGNIVRIRSQHSDWAIGAVEGDWYLIIHKEGGTISTSVEGLQVGSQYTVRWYERDRETFAPKQLQVTAFPSISCNFTQFDGSCAGNDLSNFVASSSDACKDACTDQTRCLPCYPTL